MPSPNYVYRAKLIRVVDGDTVDVSMDLGFYTYRRIRVRLADIDAPEKRKADPAGHEAAGHLASLLGDHELIVWSRGKRSFDRWVGVLWAGEAATVSVNQQMVDDGHAVRSDWK